MQSVTTSQPVTSPRTLLNQTRKLFWARLANLAFADQLIGEEFDAAIDCTATVLGVSMGRDTLWAPSPCDSTLPTTCSCAYDTPTRMGSPL